MQPLQAPRAPARFRRLPRDHVPAELMDYWNRRLYEKRARDWT